MAISAWSWALTLTPSLLLLLIYVAFRSGLDAKKIEMEMLLTRGKSLAKYLRAYGSRRGSEANASSEEPTAREIVDSIFQLQYGHSEYLFGILTYALVTASLLGFTLATMGFTLGDKSFSSLHLSMVPPQKDFIAAGFGAILWSFYEFADRYRSGDLTPDAIFRAAARIALISAFGGLIGSFLSSKLSTPVAFGLGVLPIPAIKNFISTRTLKALGSPAPTVLEGKPSLDCIQGWNDDVKEKLHRAGVSTVEQLSCTNPFTILLRSNLEWRVILDLCDQALLVVYLEERAPSIRRLGFRSAGELAGVYWYRNDLKDFTVDEAIGEVATALDMSVLQTRMIIWSLSEDITVSLISEWWSDDTPGPHSDEDAESDGDEDGGEDSQAGDSGDPLAEDSNRALGREGEAS